MSAAFLTAPRGAPRLRRALATAAAATLVAAAVWALARPGTHAVAVRPPATTPPVAAAPTGPPLRSSTSTPPPTSASAGALPSRPGLPAGVPPTPPAALTAAPTGTPVGTGGADRPGSGTYAYWTSGDEHTSGLGGGEDGYGPRTAAVVAGTACGWSFAWSSGSGRDQGAEFCAASIGEFDVISPRLPGGGERFRCAGGRCSAAGGDHAAVRSTVVSRGRMVSGVSTIEVEAVHIHDSVTVTGPVAGTVEVDRWVDAATGLPLRWDQSASLSWGSGLAATTWTDQLSLSLADDQPSPA